MNRIVYVSPEGRLFTIGPEGDASAQPLVREPQGPAQAPSGPSLLADLSTSYAWPTWSPDGTRVAASRVRVSEGETHVSVQVIDVASGEARTVYANDTPGLVADGAPHYLYWSPDGRALGLLSASPRGLALLVQDLDTAGPPGPVTVAEGVPLFFHWRPDGQAMLVHHGEDLMVVRRPFDQPASQQLLAAGGGFRAPAFSPNGGRLAYTASAPGGHHLMVGRVAEAFAAQPVLNVGPQAAFMWSPDSRGLAVADQEDPANPSFARLRVVPAEGGPAHTLAEEPLLAFFWSPDGQRIAWVTLDPSQQLFQWKVAPMSHGAAPAPDATLALLSFQPSAPVFTLLQFFDQYAHSHSLWSPDSSQLVVAGTRGPMALTSRGNGHTPTGDRVLVLDPAAAGQPRDVASGILACWSWR